jgi:hypothetical protein
MGVGELMADAFGRVTDALGRATAGLTVEELCWRPDPDSNSVAWLAWHLSRVQDGHLAELMDAEEVWIEHGWAERFRLGLDPADTGYGHTADQVVQVRVDAALLGGYHDDVQERILPWVRSIRSDELERVVDERWDPPVTLGVRLVSVVADSLEHAGQAGYLHGLLERRRSAR